MIQDVGQSPLKALNNDVRRNLLRPLASLRSHFEQAGEDFPDIAVQTRSGDTPGEERRRMVRRPPEILITTPESLNLLLSSRSGRSMLTGIATVILDEIHAVVDSKRGTHLITAVDRLVPLAGEFQRVALSATVNPLELVADLAAGPPGPERALTAVTGSGRSRSSAPALRRSMSFACPCLPSQPATARKTASGPP